jgi:hypothetical protein
MYIVPITMEKADAQPSEGKITKLTKNTSAVATNYYSNNAQVIWTGVDAVIFFNEVVPQLDPNSSQLIAAVVSPRAVVTMSHQHMVSFYNALKRVVESQIETAAAPTSPPA